MVPYFIGRMTHDFCFVQGACWQHADADFAFAHQRAECHQPTCLCCSYMYRCVCLCALPHDTGVLRLLLPLLPPQELYSQQYMVLAGIATGFTVGPHVFMSLLLIIRQGWLQAASQACGFILTLNPFESLTPIPQGILGLFVISIGFIAYVLIAASGAGLVLRSWGSAPCVSTALGSWIV